MCLTLYQDVGFNEEQNSGYLKCLASGVYEALLYECAKTGYDRINCIRIIEEDAPEELLEYLKEILNLGWYHIYLKYLWVKVFK